MKKGSLLVALFLVIGVYLSSRESWEGNASTAREGNFETVGSFALSNSFSRGTRVLVENLETGAQETVAITDRIMFNTNFFLLLSRQAADRLGIASGDVVRVKAEIEAEAFNVDGEPPTDLARSPDPDLNPVAVAEQELGEIEDEEQPAVAAEGEASEAPPEPEPEAPAAAPAEEAAHAEAAATEAVVAEAVATDTVLAEEPVTDSALEDEVPDEEPPETESDEPDGPLEESEETDVVEVKASVSDGPPESAGSSETAEEPALPEALTAMTAPEEVTPVEEAIPAEKEPPIAVAELLEPEPAPEPLPIADIVHSVELVEIERPQPSSESQKLTLAPKTPGQSTFPEIPGPDIEAPREEAEEAASSVPRPTLGEEPVPEESPSTPQVAVPDGPPSQIEDPSVAPEPIAPVPTVSEEEGLPAPETTAASEQPPPATEEPTEPPAAEVAEVSSAESEATTPTTPVQKVQPTTTQETLTAVALEPVGPRPPAAEAPTVTPADQEARPPSEPPSKNETVAPPHEAPQPIVQPPLSKATAAPTVPTIERLAEGSYYVQLGAYRELESTESILSRIPENYPVVLFTAQPGVTYKVLIGPLTEDERGMVLSYFKTSGFSDAFLLSAK